MGHNKINLKNNVDFKEIASKFKHFGEKMDNLTVHYFLKNKSACIHFKQKHGDTKSCR